jgi:phosphoglycerate dehydrogenase-like enzyme
VRYWSRRRLSVEQERELSVGYRPLPDLVSGSDLVSLHVRANSAAEFCFGADLFERMRPGAYFVNTSRGALVDQDALGRALRDGRLAGAALDVSDPEPPPSDSPLRTLPNLVLTPHVAGRTRQVAVAYYQCACANLVRLADGEALLDLLPPPPAREDPC